MLKELHLQNFKRYRDERFTFRPEGITLLAGGNNSGKSTVLQALAVWEFCRALIESVKGRQALNAGVRRDPVGVSADEFSPIALPSLAHLWTNLDSNQGIQGAQNDHSFTLRISVKWDVPAPVVENQPPATPVEHTLQIGLKLRHDRIYVKQTHSTLLAATPIPRFAYLPPFAGIQTREERMSLAAQKRLIGRGLAGAALRNVLHDLEHRSRTEYGNLENNRARVPVAERQEFFRRDPWSQLADVLQRVFKTGLTVRPFNELHQTALHVDMFRGDFQAGEFRKFPNFNPRDIMVEGSGFLQWLSVYALAVSSEINVLLLDEPDAHLHPTLQSHLLERLKALSVENSKQALLATHSTEILRQVDHRLIFEVSTRRNGYLAESEQRVGLFAGLGSDYAPRLDKLRQHKRVVFVEGTFEEPILKLLGTTLNLPISDRLVFWVYSGGHKERRHVFDQLRREIPDLEGLSLRDRDNLEPAVVNAQLRENGYADGNRLRFRTWRRRHLENYLIYPATIATLSNRPENDVVNFLNQHYGLTVGADFTASACSPGLLDARGKEILYEGYDLGGGNRRPHVEGAFGCSRHDIARALPAAAIPNDMVNLLTELQQLAV